MTEDGWMTTEEEVRLSVKTLLVATVPEPNIAYHLSIRLVKKAWFFYRVFHRKQPMEQF